MMTSYSEYLRSETWKRKSYEAKVRALGRCQLCDSNGRLHVHHRKYPGVLGEEPVSDLTVLCEACHAKFHDKVTHNESCYRRIAARLWGH